VQRFVRQVPLPEIGEAGQRRIGLATAAVAGAGLAHEVAARYAEAAGFGAVAPGPVDVDALAPAAVVTDARAREVLAGARAALAELRRAALVTPEATPEAAS
jgi:molybdopterin/thiamine biosynthesis adenylyltransferase